MLLRFAGRRVAPRAKPPGRLLRHLRALRRAGAYAAFPRAVALHRRLVRSLRAHRHAHLAAEKSPGVGRLGDWRDRRRDAAPSLNRTDFPRHG